MERRSARPSRAGPAAVASGGAVSGPGRASLRGGPSPRRSRIRGGLAALLLLVTIFCRPGPSLAPILGRLLSTARALAVASISTAARAAAGSDPFLSRHARRLQRRVGESISVASTPSHGASCCSTSCVWCQRNATCAAFGQRRSPGARF